jgi:hypothetical protein
MQQLHQLGDEPGRFRGNDFMHLDSTPLADSDLRQRGIVVENRST